MYVFVVYGTVSLSRSAPFGRNEKNRVTEETAGDADKFICVCRLDVRSSGDGQSFSWIGNFFFWFESIDRQRPFITTPDNRHTFSLLLPLYLFRPFHIMPGKQIVNVKSSTHIIIIMIIIIIIVLCMVVTNDLRGRGRRVGATKRLKFFRQSKLNEFFASFGFALLCSNRRSLSDQ